MMGVIINYQNKDGSWDYSVDLDTGQVNTILDYHQGFLLDSIMNYMKFTSDFSLPSAYFATELTWAKLPT